MHLGALLNSLHKTLGRSHIAVQLAVLLRNQCRCVIGHYLNENANLLINGEALLVRLVAPSSSIFIDVGANVGNWARLFIESIPEHGKKKALLFEPSDYAVEQLRARFQHLPDIEIIQAAVADKPGEMLFFEGPKGEETSSLVAGFSNPDTTEKMVRVTTLDTEINKRQWEHIDFLKIDTEGYDLHVLRGASGLLGKQQIGVIQFEYGILWALAGSTLAAAYSLLGSYGYKVFLLKSVGLFELDYKRYGEYFSYSNFVAVAPSKLPALQSVIKGRL